MKVESVFRNNESIPVKYTCDGENVSPPIKISNIPPEAKTLAVIVDDPDAPSGDWVHWIVFNIPVNSDTFILKENSSPGTNGKNDFQKLEYKGPCPPSGTHRYFLKIYALDSELDLSEGCSKLELENAMEGHLLDKAEIIGVYERQ